MKCITESNLYILRPLSTMWTGKKKKLLITRKSSETDKPQPKDNEKQNEGKTQENNERGGIKRSRSQRSVVDIDRGMFYKV